MIKTETLMITGKEYIRTYSDSNMQIRQDDTGAMYDEAVDPVESGRMYTETDVPIVEYYADETEAKARAYEILMGVAE